MNKEEKLLSFIDLKYRRWEIRAKNKTKVSLLRKSSSRNDKVEPDKENI